MTDWQDKTPDYLVNGKRPWNKGDKYESFINGKATQTFPDQKTPMLPPPWAQVEWCKSVFKQGDVGTIIKGEFKKLQKLDMSENKRSFCGNKIIYHFFMREMLKTKYKGGPTLEEKYKADPQKFWEQVCKMDRRKACPPEAQDIFELNRAITFFKPSIAKHIYERFNATSVLDPCAGWGGRMLGAMALGIKYQGYDTNKDLAECYDAMDSVTIGDGGSTWGVCIKSCLDADFSKDEEYDCVLTSPPYYDLEIYPHQAELGTEDEWYRHFLMPMIARSYKFMKKPGACCINISPKMYEKMLSYKFPICHEKIDFLQQKNVSQWGSGTDKQDFIYVWKK
jgi:hypothetical protein